MVLSGPRQRFKYQLAVPVGLLCAVFSNSLYHVCKVNCRSCWDAEILSMSASFFDLVDLTLLPPVAMCQS